MRLKGLSVPIAGGSSEPQALSDSILSLLGFQESSSRFCQPSLPLSASGVQASAGSCLCLHLWQPGRGLPFPHRYCGQSRTKYPGGARRTEAEMTARPGMEDGHCQSLLDDNWFRSHKMTPAPKQQSRKDRSSGAAGADPPGKCKWPAAPPPPKNSAGNSKVLSVFNCKNIATNCLFPNL